MGVEFRYVYKSAAHTGFNGFVRPFTLQERLRHVAEAKKRIGTQIPWVCDNMKNEVKHAYGRAPNGEFVIGPDGKILRKRFWSNSKTLRADLEEFVGKVENPTPVSEIKVELTTPKRTLQRGIVARPNGRNNLRPLRIEPLDLDKEQPYFCKLRVEGDRTLIRRGHGEIYLGFFLDELYQVHWNNRAGKVRFEFPESNEGLYAEPAKGESPEVKADADIDPREFFVELELDDRKSPIDLTVHYVVCDDAETFCLPITQRYHIYLEVDLDGGSQPTFMHGMFATLPLGDKNRDGQLSRDELPQENASMILNHVDRNHDDIIDRREWDLFHQMLGPPPTGNRLNQELQRLLEPK